MRETAIQGHSNRRGIHDFLLALNSNLTSIFNCSSDITSSLYSLQTKLYPVCNLLPLNLPTHYLFIIISV